MGEDATKEEKEKGYCELGIGGLYGPIICSC